MRSETTLDRERLLKEYAGGVALLEAALDGLEEPDLDLAAGPDTWTIRQLVHHVVDGDDLWKNCVKATLGNPEGLFSLQWYWDTPQDEWVAHWDYARRPIEPSLDRLRANRRHIVELLEQIPDAWDRSMRIHWPHGEERITVDYVVEMQARHVAMHVADIETIRRIHGR